MKISVAMAYYNGGTYIEEQIESILVQLGTQDELVISIDGTEDGSRESLEKWKKKDQRVHLIEGPKKGVIKNFENAISHCTGEIIFLSDQDDIWRPRKKEMVLQNFENPRIMAVLHNAVIVDENGKELGFPTLFEIRKSKKGKWKNFIKNSYVGCCMAFRKELLSIILPIPEEMYMHDYWIGMAAELCGDVKLIENPLIAYRRHGDNVTQMSHGSLSFMIKKRINMLKCLNLLKKRKKNGVRKA